MTPRRTAVLALGLAGTLSMGTFAVQAADYQDGSGVSRRQRVPREPVERDTADCDAGMEPDFGSSDCSVTVSDGTETWTTTAIPTEDAEDRELVSSFDGPLPVDPDNEPPCSSSPKFDYTDPSTDHWMFFTIGGGWHKQIESTRVVDADSGDLPGISRRQEICFVAPYRFDAWDGRRVVDPEVIGEDGDSDDRRRRSDRDDSDDDSPDDDRPDDDAPDDDTPDDDSPDDDAPDDDAPDDDTPDDDTPDDDSPDDDAPDEGSSSESEGGSGDSTPDEGDSEADDSNEAEPDEGEPDESDSSQDTPPSSEPKKGSGDSARAPADDKRDESSPESEGPPDSEDDTGAPEDSSDSSVDDGKRDSVSTQQAREPRRQFYGILPPCSRVKLDREGFPTNPCLVARFYDRRRSTVSNVVFAPAHDLDPRPKNQTR